MQRMYISAEAPEPERVAAVARILRGGGVVAFATDTTYGLAADPRSDEAVRKVFAAKGRAAALAMPLVAADLGQAREAGRLDGPALSLAEAFWPGPLSIVVPADPRVSRLALGGGTSVALRVPAHAVARALAREFGFPLTATSANPSGAAAAETADDVAASIGAVVDLIVDSGRAPGGPPSTIVSVEAGAPVLVRAGAIAWNRVLESLE